MNRFILVLCAGFVITALPETGRACDRCIKNMRFFGLRVPDPPAPQENQIPPRTLVAEVLRWRPVVRGSLLWLLAVPLLGLAGAAVAKEGSGVRWRRSAESIRGRMGAEPSLVDENLEGQSVTLSGRLVVRGKPAERFEDGAPMAAATASTWSRLGRESISVNARAQGLELAQGQTRVRLDGPLEVLLGSTETRGRSAKALRADIQDRLLATNLSAHELLGPGRVTLKSLRQGDCVRVRGVLHRTSTPGEDSTYRRPATRWVLDGEQETASGLALAAAYEGLPARPPSKRPLVGGGLVGALIAALVLAISGHIGLTTCSLDCVDQLIGHFEGFALRGRRGV